MTVMRALACLVVGACGSQPQPSTTPHSAADGPDTATTPPPPPSRPPEDGVAIANASSGVRFGRDSVCVTHGSMRGLHVSDSSMRAVVQGSSGDAGAVEFAYDGATKDVSRLKSGAVREQMALKLRAADGCNLVYVVWRFSPEPLLVVQTKVNPGKHTNAECSTDNYTTISETPLARPAPGTKHLIEASIHGDHLFTKVDGQPVWDGALPGYVRDMHGPFGVRTDNVEATVALIGPAGSQRDDAARCH
jgi:hypothetical protein